MKKLLLREAAKHKLQNRRRKRWQKTVSILACLVVFCTVYALILPALTAEADTYCGKEEHTHTEDCYKDKLICGKEEGQGAHHHTDDCYREVEALVCPTPESDGHQHTEACYTEEQVLTCTNTDEGHVHSEFDSCYTTEKELTCGMEEGEGAHHHTAECYETKKELICGQEENDGHRHTAECYEKELICGKEEHTHTLACYSNPDADVENGDVWQNTVCSVTLTGNWGADLAAIAQTQTGYAESTANYAVAEDGQTIHGYTRYGAWANDPYRDNWSAQFADFCLSYAGVPTSAVPQNSDCSAWNYTIPDGYTPKTGDLLLLDTDNNGSADHAGIVITADDSALTAIVGDADKAVRNNTYNIGSENIKGYVSIPENPALADDNNEEETTETTPAPEVTEEPQETPTPETDENKNQNEDDKKDDTKKDDTANNIEVTPTPVIDQMLTVTPTPEISILPDNKNDRIQEDDDTEGTVWCIVNQDITEVNSSEAEEEQQEDEVETYSEDEIETYSDDGIALESYAVMAAGAGSNSDILLDDYITGVSMSKLSNGQWTTLSGDQWTLTDGDKILVDLNYAVNGGLPAGKNSMSYQLPPQIVLAEEVTGPVTQKGVTVGEFTISKNGQVNIQLDSNKFKPNESFTGTFQFEGEASRLGDGEDGKIKFPGVDKNVVIEKDTSQYDLTISKEGKLKEDNKTLDYTITVSSNLGTENKTIDIKDHFNNGSDNQNSIAKYKRDTFKLIKVNANGEQTEIKSPSPTFGTENGNEKFEYTNLPALGKGEKYVVTYEAEATPTASTGGGNVSNSAGAVTPNKNSWSTKDISIPGVMIKKSGYYDQDSDQIIWTIVVNQDEMVDLAGYTIADILPEGLQPVSITISPALPNNQTISDLNSFVFPEGSGKKAYTIKYVTTVPLSDGKVTNTVNVNKDNNHWSDSAEVSTTSRKDGITKNWSGESVDANKNPIYNWTTHIDVSKDGVSEIQYRDTILSAQDTQGNLKEDTHYAIASELYKSLTNNFALKVSSTQTLNYTQTIQAGYNVELHFYSAENNEVTDIQSSNSHVRYFIVNVKKQDSSIVKVCNLELRYYTHVDYSNMSAQEKWTFKNKGIYGTHEAEGSHTYEKPPKFIKQTGVKDAQGNVSYQNGSRRVDYKIADGYLYYRLLIRPDKDEEIIITDTLSDPGMSFDMDSVKARFYFNDYQVLATCYDGNHSYNFDGNEKPNVEVTKNTDTNTQILTVKVKPGYTCHSQKHESLAVIYRVKISDDPVWKDLNVTGKIYENTAKWGTDISSAKTIVENREIEKVQKSGIQRVETDDQGGKSYKDIIDYDIVINPAGLDLIPDKNTLELIDNLTCPDGVKAYLDLTSVKLYAYDSLADNHKGAVLDRANYKVQYDDSDSNKPKMVVTVPDEKACVLTYSYIFDRGGNQGTDRGDGTTGLQINNSANIEGTYSSGNTVNIIKQKGSATVDQANITIYKVDGKDYSVRLQNAEFKLEAYQNGTWTVTNVNLNNSNVNGSYNSESERYVTGSEGYLKFDVDTDSKHPNPNKLQPNTIYRLTETKAPSGYKINENPYYFVLLKDKTESDFKNTEPLNNVKNVYFFDTGKAVSMTVPNEFTGVSVRKVWEDSDGNITTDTSEHPPITVELYRQKSKRNGCKVTFEFKKDNYIQKSILYVKPGSNIQLILNKSYNNAGDEVDKAMLQYGFKNTNSGWVKTISDTINNDQDFVLDVSTDKVLNGTKQHDWGISSTSINGEEDNSFIGDMTENPIKIGSSELKGGNWSYTWSGLPATDETGLPYYYFVKENVPNNCDVRYTNNNGVEVGKEEIVITNREKEKLFELPETGGTGTNRFTAMGLALMAGSLMYGYVMRRKRREGRRN